MYQVVSRADGMETPVAVGIMRIRQGVRGHQHRRGVRPCNLPRRRSSDPPAKRDQDKPEGYDLAASRLAAQFVENFRKFDNACPTFGKVGLEEVIASTRSVQCFWNRQERLASPAALVTRQSRSIMSGVLKAFRY